ncbi:hypothetical protein ACIRYZ_32385 [Kitasatospora sp. NPDC101155]|uniref:hypothetical protein n=1 Tax=Kitasatospora sp. NPDC101155 TaxID=3364097 RepID=UPI00380FED86
MHPAAIAFRNPAALHARCDHGGYRRTYFEPDYETGAVLPDATSWDPLPVGYAERFAPGYFTPGTGLVELFKLPSSVTDRDTLAAMVGTLGDPHPVTLGDTEDPPGVPTTHVLPESGKRPGLHVDNHQNLPYGERRKARRRLCVNLGPGSRYLLVADTDILSICRCVRDRYEDHHPSTGDLRTYLALHRPLRLLRLRVDPGEGWLAPTSFLPYDESTEGLDRPSATSSWLGHWEPYLFDPLI